jgi:hypothetical protein
VRDGNGCFYGAVERSGGEANGEVGEGLDVAGREEGMSRTRSFLLQLVEEAIFTLPRLVLWFRVRVTTV